jgi:glyoxylase-like metal-dependent hydrolase (beta-lactamase superfamily II)
MVNAYLVADSPERDAPWVLIDTGLPGYAKAIQQAAAHLFGRPPALILLTHGHFDHVGNVRALAAGWGVPVYAHPLEMPYLTGRSAYPPPDPSAGGGALAWSAAMNPCGPIDLGARVQPLPEGGIVPGLSGWIWLRTPGHTTGHVSFYRESDGTLIAGDAVVTTRQESVMDVLRQREIVWRPPAYMTSDWHAARRSVEMLAALEPEVLATGHGHVLRGERMRCALHDLADRFDRVMPSRGRYVPFPAVADERGVMHVPPRVGFSTASQVAIGAAAVVTGLTLFAAARRGAAFPAHR